MEQLPDSQNSSPLILRPKDPSSTFERNILTFDIENNLPNRKVAEGELQEAINKSADLLREKIAPQMKEILLSLYELCNIDPDILSNPEFSANPQFLERYSYETQAYVLKGAQIGRQISERLIVTSGNTWGKSQEESWIRHYSSWCSTIIEDTQTKRKLELQTAFQGENSFKYLGVVIPNKKGSTHYQINAPYYLRRKADEFVAAYNYDWNMTRPNMKIPLGIRSKNHPFDLEAHYLPDLNDTNKLTLAPFGGLSIIDNIGSNFVNAIVNYDPSIRDTFELYERFRKEGESLRLIKMNNAVTVNGKPEDWYSYFAIYESNKEVRALHLIEDKNHPAYQSYVDIGDIVVPKTININELDIFEKSVFRP
jgi:hypothetical protein